MIDSATILELVKTRGEPAWLIEKREQALKIFESLPEPRFVYGLGILVDVSELDIESIDVLQNKEEVRVIAPKGVEVLSFAQALRSEVHADLIKNHFMTAVGVDENKFSALHVAGFNNGLLIRIPKGKSFVEPIRIHLQARANAVLDQILVIAEEQSSALIIEDTDSDDGAKFHSKIVEVIAKDASKIDYVSIQELGDDVWHFSKKGARIGCDASVTWSDCALGGKFSQVFTTSDLDGQGASAKTQGIYFGIGKQRFDVRCCSIHHVPNTSANMTTRTVLDNGAKAVYRGLIRIEKGASETISHQKSDTLLLGDDARADVVPELEIENEDVKCSHGATIGQIDEDVLFYMTSRGIDMKSAKQHIIKGFFKPILDAITDEQLRLNLDVSINRRLEVDI